MIKHILKKKKRQLKVMVVVVVVMMMKMMKMTATTTTTTPTPSITMQPTITWLFEVGQSLPYTQVTGDPRSQVIIVILYTNTHIIGVYKH